MQLEYAVKAQTSLAPLSRFRGSHITTAHEQQCCRFQSYAKTVPSPMKIDKRNWPELCEDCAIANEIDKRNWQSVNHIPGIHDNGPRLWRLTLTAYNHNAYAYTGKPLIIQYYVHNINLSFMVPFEEPSSLIEFSCSKCRCCQAYLFSEYKNSNVHQYFIKILEGISDTDLPIIE